MRNVDAVELQLAFPADGDRVYHRAESRHPVGFSAPLLERDGLHRTFGQRFSPTRHLHGDVERADHVVLVGKAGAGNELTAVPIRILARSVSKLVHEALAIE